MSAATTMPPERVALFWSKTVSDGDCLLWTGGKTGRGYGAFRVDGRDVQAHRLAYTLSHGHIPHGMVVRHACDRPSCIAPAHLQVGTVRDNSHDMLERGRHVAHNRVIPAADVVVLRRLRAEGVQVSALSRQFGVSAGHVSQIAAGKCRQRDGGPITPSLAVAARVDALLESMKITARNRAQGVAPRTIQAVEWIARNGDSWGCITKAAQLFGVSRQAVSAALRLKKRAQAHAGAQVLGDESGVRHGG